MADLTKDKTIYLGVVRVEEKDASQKCRFYAANVNSAIDKLCGICGVKSTLGLYEYEIMELLFDEKDEKKERPTGYKPVASKFAPRSRLGIPSTMPPVVEPKKEAMDRVDNGNTLPVPANVSSLVLPKRDETSYTPYKVRVDV